MLYFSACNVFFFRFAQKFSWSSANVVHPEPHGAGNFRLAADSDRSDNIAEHDGGAPLALSREPGNGSVPAAAENHKGTVQRLAGLSRFESKVHPLASQQSGNSGAHYGNLMVRGP